MLHSFVLWVATEPETVGICLAADMPLEPVSVITTHKYPAAVRAWNITQGWPPLLSIDEMSNINWSLCSLGNLQGA